MDLEFKILDGYERVFVDVTELLNNMSSYIKSVKLEVGCCYDEEDKFDFINNKEQILTNIINKIKNKSIDKTIPVERNMIIITLADGFEMKFETSEWGSVSYWCQ